MTSRCHEKETKTSPCMLFSDPISHLLVLQRTRAGIDGMRAKRVLGNLVATPWEAWKMQSNEEEGGNLDREKRMSTLEAVVQTTNR